MKVLAAAGNLTDIGRIREENQDYFGDFQPEGSVETLGRLVLIADGVSGHRAGALASRLAVDVVAEAYYLPLPGSTHLEESAPDVATRLQEAFREANRRLFRKSRENPSMKGMASTCTALVLHQGQAYGAHVGDTRAYLLRAGRLTQLTHDHSAVQERIDRGLLSQAEILKQPDRNLITRSLGFEPDVVPDLLPPLALERADRLLLSSDGLHGVVPAEEICTLLGEGDPQEACEQLVAAANERGGPDNITVQVLRIDEPRSEGS